jgi:hypothetical protein
MSSFLESLAAMQPIPRRYQLFISHAWDYKGDYERLIELLNGYPFFEWDNLSVPVDKPLATLLHLPRSYRYLVRQLDERISKADCLLVLAGMYVAQRGWIQSEIEAAKAFHKPVIAVEPRGSERFPDALVQSADERVGWNSTSIISAIRRCASPATNDLPLLFGEHSSTGWSR